MGRTRAFTLLEMMIAMAMAGIIAAAGLASGMFINRNLVESRKRLALRDEAKRLEEALLTIVQQAGGDPLRPHQAIVVENNGCPAHSGLPACPTNVDRLTISSADETLPACKVVGVSGDNLDIIPSGPNACCLRPTSPASSEFEGRNAFLLRDDGVLVPLKLHNVHGGCFVNVPPGLGNPPVSDLGTGTLVAVDTRVLFTQPDPDLAGALQLIEWRDQGTPTSPPDDLVQTEELTLVADHVFDFQVALGYDGDGDGSVDDTGSTTDEWASTVVGDALPGTISDDELRMIGIGVIVGGPMQSGGSPTRVYDGDTHTPAGVYTVATQSKVAIRNLNVSVP